MGGKGSGGLRVGAGRRSEQGSVRWLREQRRKRKGTAPRQRVVPPKSLLIAVLTPDDLPDGQASVWRALAPHAMAARTLVPATAWAFRDLVEAIVLKRDMLALIEQEGLTSTSLKTQMDVNGGGNQVLEPKAHPLLTRHAALMARVEAGLTRFRLSPMGKEIAPVDEPADEFAEFDHPLVLVKGGK